MTEILELLARADAVLSEVARVDRSTLGDEELVAVLKAEARIDRVLDASNVLSAGEVAERSRYELGAAGLSTRLGERKPINFLEQVTLVSYAEAGRRVRIGAAIRNRQNLVGEILPPEHPILAEAMVNGLVGIDSASTVLNSLKQASTGSEASPQRMDEAELALVELGTHQSADLVADAGRLWRDALDPDGIEPRYEDIRERRMITVGRERNGIKNYNIKADPELSAVLDAVFLDSMDKKVGPRFLSDEDLARATTVIEDIDGEPIETLVDPRSREQKLSDILQGVLLAGLRATREGATNHRTVGSVTAIISMKDLREGTGFGVLEGVDEVIPASVVQQLACESGYYPVIIGERGEPLFHGTLKRHFTESQRRAMIARDGDRCVVPGCKSRAASAEAHHVVFWSLRGPTDIDNGVLLCPAHHHALHQGAFEVKMVDGMPYYRSDVDRGDERAWTPVSRNRLLLATT
ncbi:MAG TPA: DUF222 domain-containing protein [Galbitalea sp.]|jgi:hypothetical protein